MLLDNGAAGLEAQGIVAAQPLGVWDFFRMFLVLILVLALIYGLYFLLKKTNKAAQPESSVIRVLATQSLAPGRHIHVVEVGQEILVLGSTDQAVNLMLRLEPGEAADELRLEATREAGDQKKTFSEVLGNLFTPAVRKDGDS